MAVIFKTPDQVAEEYLVQLKALKPEVNTDQTDSDWWVRSRVVGGLISGLYGDMVKVSNDAFPRSSRREATERHLAFWFGDTLKAAQQSAGPVKVTGTFGTVINAGLQMTYTPNGNTYQVVDTVTLDDVSGVVSVQSVSTGQSQNLLEGASLSISSPPGGLDSTAVVFGADISDGRDEETLDEAALRIEARVQQPVAGGTESDYEAYALEADPSVTGAKVLRFIYGLGTVGLVVTSGTTDIDSAVDNGDSIARIPSDALLDTVLAYVDAKNPINDCLHVLKPQEIEQDVTFRVRYIDGYTGSSIITGQTLTLNELLEREIKRALYKVTIGGVKLGASGYVVASHIEEVVDLGLSSSPYQEGTIAQVILDRQIEDLTASGTNRLLRPTELVAPGTITIIEES